MRKLLLFLSMIFMLSFTSNAQSWIKKLGNTAKDAAQRAVEEKVERKSDEVTNKVMDRAEESVAKKGDEDNTDVRKRESDENDDVSEHDHTVSGSDEKGSTVLQSFSSYDFVPGDQILYFEDFSSDAIGDFPATWTSNSGGEVKRLIYPMAIGFICMERMPPIVICIPLNSLIILLWNSTLFLTMNTNMGHSSHFIRRISKSTKR